MLKVVATGTLFCFLTTQCVSAAPGAGIEMAGQRELPSYLSIDIPPELGTVDALYEAPAGANTQFILHIQNAHANYQAQMKIKQLLGHMNKKYGFKTIFVEGASEKLDADYLRLFPDQERNLKLCDELAKQGELTGAELYMMEADKNIEALGIEEASLYKANYDALKKVFGAEADVSHFFKGFDGKLDKVASQTFSPETRELIADWKRFEQGRRDFMPFVKSLTVKSKKILNVDLESLFAQVGWPQISRLLVIQQLEKDMNKTKGQEEQAKLIKVLRTQGVSKELLATLENFNEGSIAVGKSATEVSPREVLERLAQEAGPKGFKFSDYPAFSLFAGYVTLRSELDPKVLFEEIEYLFTQMLDTLAQEPQQKALLALYRDGELLRKLLHLELNRTQWQQLLSNKDQVAIPSLAARLVSAVRTTDQRPETRDQSQKVSSLQSPVSSRQSVSDVMPPKFAAKMDELFTAGLEFYDFAHKREAVFYKEMQSQMAEKKITKAILITGGFHTDGMSDLFRENAISYGIVTPRLSEKSDENLYRVAMLQDREHLFSISYLEMASKLMSDGVLAAQGIRPEEVYAVILGAMSRVGDKNIAGVVEIFNQSELAVKKGITLIQEVDAQGKPVKDSYKVRSSSPEAQSVTINGTVAATVSEKMALPGGVLVESGTIFGTTGIAAQKALAPILENERDLRPKEPAPQFGKYSMSPASVPAVLPYAGDLIRPIRKPGKAKAGKLATTAVAFSIMGSVAFSANLVEISIQPEFVPATTNMPAQMVLTPIIVVPGTNPVYAVADYISSTNLLTGWNNEGTGIEGVFEPGTNYFGYRSFPLTNAAAAGFFAMNLRDAYTTNDVMDVGLKVAPSAVPEATGALAATGVPANIEIVEPTVTNPVFTVHFKDQGFVDVTNLLERFVSKDAIFVMHQVLGADGVWERQYARIPFNATNKTVDFNSREIPAGWEITEEEFIRARATEKQFIQARAEVRLTERDREIIRMALEGVSNQLELDERVRSAAGTLLKEMSSMPDEKLVEVLQSLNTRLPAYDFARTSAGTRLPDPFSPIKTILLNVGKPEVSVARAEVRLTERDREIIRMALEGVSNQLELDERVRSAAGTLLKEMSSMPDEKLVEVLQSLNTRLPAYDFARTSAGTRLPDPFSPIKTILLNVGKPEVSVARAEIRVKAADLVAHFQRLADQPGERRESGMRIPSQRPMWLAAIEYVKGLNTDEVDIQAELLKLATAVSPMFGQNAELRPAPAGSEKAISVMLAFNQYLFSIGQFPGSTASPARSEVRVKAADLVAHFQRLADQPGERRESGMRIPSQRPMWLAAIEYVKGLNTDEVDIQAELLKLATAVSPMFGQNAELRPAPAGSEKAISVMLAFNQYLLSIGQFPGLTATPARAESRGGAVAIGLYSFMLENQAEEVHSRGDQKFADLSFTAPELVEVLRGMALRQGAVSASIMNFGGASATKAEMLGGVLLLAKAGLLTKSGEVDKTRFQLVTGLQDLGTVLKKIQTAAVAEGERTKIIAGLRSLADRIEATQPAPRKEVSDLQKLFDAWVGPKKWTPNDVFVPRSEARGQGAAGLPAWFDRMPMLQEPTEQLLRMLPEEKWNDPVFVAQYAGYLAELFRQTEELLRAPFKDVGYVASKLPVYEGDVFQDALAANFMLSEADRGMVLDLVRRLPRADEIIASSKKGGVDRERAFNTADQTGGLYAVISGSIPRAEARAVSEKIMEGLLWATGISAGLVAFAWTGTMTTDQVLPYVGGVGQGSFGMSFVGYQKLLSFSIGLFAFTAVSSIFHWLVFVPAAQRNAQIARLGDTRVGSLLHLGYLKLQIMALVKEIKALVKQNAWLRDVLGRPGLKLTDDRDMSFEKAGRAANGALAPVLANAQLAASLAEIDRWLVDNPAAPQDVLTNVNERRAQIQAELGRSEVRLTGPKEELIKAAQKARGGDITTESALGREYAAPKFYDVFGIPNGSDYSLLAISEKPKTQPQRLKASALDTDLRDRNPTIGYRQIGNDGFYFFLPADMDIPDFVRTDLAQKKLRSKNSPDTAVSVEISETENVGLSVEIAKEGIRAGLISAKPDRRNGANVVDYSVNDPVAVPALQYLQSQEIAGTTTVSLFDKNQIMSVVDMYRLIATGKAKVTDGGGGRQVFVSRSETRLDAARLARIKEALLSTLAGNTVEQNLVPELQSRGFVNVQPQAGWRINPGQVVFHNRSDHPDHGKVYIVLESDISSENMNGTAKVRVLSRGVDGWTNAQESEKNILLGDIQVVFELTARSEGRMEVVDAVAMNPAGLEQSLFGFRRGTVDAVQLLAAKDGEKITSAIQVSDAPDSWVGPVLVVQTLQGQHPIKFKVFDRVVMAKSAIKAVEMLKAPRAPGENIFATVEQAVRKIENSIYDNATPLNRGLGRMADSKLASLALRYSKSGNIPNRGAITQEIEQSFRELLLSHEKPERRDLIAQQLGQELLAPEFLQAIEKDPSLYARALSLYFGQMNDLKGVLDAVVRWNAEVPIGQNWNAQSAFVVEAARWIEAARSETRKGEFRVTQEGSEKNTRIIVKQVIKQREALVLSVDPRDPQNAALDLQKFLNGPMKTHYRKFPAAGQYDFVAEDGVVYRYPRNVRTLSARGKSFSPTVEGIKAALDSFNPQISTAPRAEVRDLAKEFKLDAAVVNALTERRAAYPLTPVYGIFDLESRIANAGRLDLESITPSKGNRPGILVRFALRRNDGVDRSQALESIKNYLDTVAKALQSNAYKVQRSDVALDASGYATLEVRIIPQILALLPRSEGRFTPGVVDIYKPEGRPVVEQQRRVLAEEVWVLLGKTPEVRRKLISTHFQRGVDSLADVLGQIIVPVQLEMLNAEDVAAMLTTLVALKAGDLNWQKFLSLAKNILENPIMAVSDKSGGMVTVKADAPSDEDFKNMSLRLGTKTQLVERFVIANDALFQDAAAQAVLKGAIQNVQNSFDHKGAKIGPRVQIEFKMRSSKSALANSAAAALMRGNAAITRANLTILIEEGLDLSGQFVGTVLRAQKQAQKRNAAIRSLLAGNVAQNGVDQTNALLRQQVGDNVLEKKGDGLYDINEILLEGLTKLWSDMLTQKATSVSA